MAGRQDRNTALDRQDLGVQAGQVVGRGVEALNAVFTMPGAVELIRRWQGRHPYKAVWVNHRPLP
ncbi:hypothetical protein B9W64_25720 [Streptomyces sp. CS159]|uniref:hypothetical protein n=1 Tax=Streptomyces sp. CS159 TaxID=1982762 RepID=UPI000B40F59F|nr:hypothetical protein [Streptomyces sp. CS159]OWA07542.1 hypothetical protein B9W64_25720 [Streptomyces sp. CS159]